MSKGERMKIKKIILYGVLLIISPLAIARDVRIVNGTPFKATVHVRYAGESIASCRPDNLDVNAGEILSINAGICLVKKIWADVFEKNDNQVKIKMIEKNSIKTANEFSSSLGTFDSNFHIFGPMLQDSKPGVVRTFYGVSKTFEPQPSK